MASQRLFARSSLAVAAAAGAVSMATTRPVYADAEGSSSSGSSSSVKTKPPIYSSSGDSIKVVETHTALEQHVGQARRAIVSSTESLRGSLHSTIQSWIGVERRVERRVLDILPRDEPLTPGWLYVGVATLAGSVFGRYRSLPIRLISPPIFFLASINYFLPKTSHNLALYYKEVEAAHLPPAVKEQREALVNSTRGLWSKGEEQAHVAAKKVEGGWKEGLAKVQEGTGLKVGTEGSKAV